MDIHFSGNKFRGTLLSAYKIAAMFAPCKASLIKIWVSRRQDQGYKAIRSLFSFVRAAFFSLRGLRFPLRVSARFPLRVPFPSRFPFSLGVLSSLLPKIKNLSNALSDLKKSAFSNIRTFDLLFLSLQSFKNRPMRTFLTILGVGVGIGAILFLVSLGFGLQRVLLEKITTDEALLSLDVTSSSSIIKLDNKAISVFQTMEQIDKISPLASVASQMSIKELNTDVIVNIVDPLYLRLAGISPKEGRIFKEEESQGIVISEALASSFDLSPKEALGVQATFVFFVPKAAARDSETLVSEIDIVPHEAPYTIVGVTDENIIPLVFLPRSSIPDVTFPSYDELKVKVKDEKQLEQVREEILSRGYMVSALSETIDQANAIFRIVQIILSIFGIISLIVASIGLINTMTISLLERTNDIGIMRAIGASRRDIWLLFVSESLIIGFMGGVAGIVIGFLGSQIVNVGFRLLATALGGKAVDLFAYPLWFLFFILFLSSFVGLIAGIWPARRAANFNPLAALRYK